MHASRRYSSDLHYPRRPATYSRRPSLAVPDSQSRQSHEAGGPKARRDDPVAPPTRGAPPAPHAIFFRRSGARLDRMDRGRRTAYRTATRAGASYPYAHPRTVHVRAPVRARGRRAGASASVLASADRRWITVAAGAFMLIHCWPPARACLPLVPSMHGVYVATPSIDKIKCLKK